MAFTAQQLHIHNLSIIIFEVKTYCTYISLCYYKYCYENITNLQR